jgi:hypothetical protein
LNDNPYTPPAQHDPIPNTPIEEAKRRLAPPATALIIMSSIHSVLLAIPLVNECLRISQGITLTAELRFMIATSFFHFLLMVFFSIGAAKMGFLESYRLGRISSLLACIPFVSPFYLLGIPFGIWAYVLLGKPKIKAAFEQQRMAMLYKRNQSRTVG